MGLKSADLHVRFTVNRLLKSNMPAIVCAYIPKCTSVLITVKH